MATDLAAILAKTAFAYAAGLFAPGWLAARWLRSRAAWAVALPISMVFLLLGVLALDAAGLPIRFGALLAWQATIAALLGLLAWRARRRPGAAAPDAPPPGEAPRTPDEPDDGPAWRWLLVAGVVLVLLLAALRGFLAPLAGFDASWRWDLLARQLLSHETLAFYPPVSAADFCLYFFPDGFAPIVSTAIWWLYSAAGRAVPEATLPLALAQYAGALALAFQLAERLHSRRAGWYAVAVLAATPLFLQSAMAGQETGLTALAVLGSMHAMVHSRGPHDLRAAALAGLVVAAGALAREYGPALAACALAVALWRRLGWRTLGLFAGVVALAVTPWLLRNGLRSGNPLYSLGAGLLPVNPIVAALLRFYGETSGLATIALADWLALARHLLLLAAWSALVGLPAAIWLARRHGFLAAAVALLIALWLASVGYSNGGLLYTARVLSPVLALLSIPAAIALAEGSGPPLRRRAATVALAASLLYASGWAAVYPYVLMEPGDWSLAAGALLQPFSRGEPVTEERLASALPPGTRVLAENQYAHAELVAVGSSRQLVPAWSPEVSFLYDRALDAGERRRRLSALGIGAVTLAVRSLNVEFLREASPFFADDLRSWRVAWSDGDGVLLVPPP